MELLIRLCIGDVSLDADCQEFWCKIDGVSDDDDSEPGKCLSELPDNCNRTTVEPDKIDNQHIHRRPSQLCNEVVGANLANHVHLRLSLNSRDQAVAHDGVRSCNTYTDRLVCKSYHLSLTGANPS